MHAIDDTQPFRHLSLLDRGLGLFGEAVVTVWGAPAATRPMPRPDVPGDPLSAAERRHAGALMRVNHVGEVCAQALYSAQALMTRDPERRRFYEHAATEESDHLAWTRRRLSELGATPSRLNPFWFAGAFALGALAGALGDRVSLGFMAETERQVERHLADHEQRLPAQDEASRRVLAQMRRDEAEHASAASALGGLPLPGVVRGGMRAAARVMTTLAYWI